MHLPSMNKALKCHSYYHKNIIINTNVGFNNENGANKNGTGLVELQHSLYT